MLYGGQLKNRSNDTEFRFRPDSDFYYLTGIAEPGAVLVFRPGHTPHTVVFTRPRDPKSEVWTGRRMGPQGAMDNHGMDGAHTLSQLKKELPSLLDGVSAVFFPLGQHRRLEDKLMGAWAELRRRNRDGASPPRGLMDARPILDDERLIKDEAAIESLRRATDISAAAHTAAMRWSRPGRHEYEIEALIECHFRMAGSGGPGYNTIVGSGENATILHYIENRSPLRSGEMLLIDAGCEWEQFTADITRSFPVNGRFTAAQRQLYDIVLLANEVGIKQSTVGSSIAAIHKASLRVLCEGLIDLKFLNESLDTVLEKHLYKRFYMHRTSHWLGVDVHDVGDYSVERQPRPLEAGNVLTVEPGLYIAPNDDTVPRAFRGIGIRIEDDVLVRSQGPEVLSHAVPKAVADLEALVGTEDCALWR